MTNHLSSKTRNHWKTQWKTIESASKFHNRVRDIFATDPYFKYMKCYQEVNVRDLVPDYPHHNHHFDWFVEELNTIIELHGDHHYRVVNYGNIGYEEAQRNHIRIKDRDNTKKHAAVTNGYIYVAIPYSAYKKLNAQTLKQYIFYGGLDE